MKSTIEIPSESWKNYLESYLPLMKMISYRVNGDYITCDKEDNLQDLCVSGLESLLTWKRKFPDSTFEEILEDPNFDKYTKTCLWNLKNKKGKNVTKKIFLYKNKISLDVQD